MWKKYLIKPSRGIRLYVFAISRRLWPHCAIRALRHNHDSFTVKSDKEFEETEKRGFFWQNMHVAVLGDCNQPRAPYTREYCARLIKICKCSSEVLLSHEAILRLFFAKTTYELWCRACMLKLNSGSTSRVSRRTISSSWSSHFTQMLEDLRPLLVIMLRFFEKAENFFWKIPLF